jgi:hypothetical protein
MSIVVYYLSANMPRCVIFDDDQMAESLAKCQLLRQTGCTHVTISQEMLEQVGKNDRGGIVSDGKLPNGDDYKWSKAHRAGAKSQKEIIKK